MNRYKIIAAALVILAAIATYLIYFGESLNKPLELVKVHVGIQDKIPDPAKIEVAGDWYFLDHISSGLVGFDHIEGKFKPLLAESWQSFSSGVHTFTLRDDAKFHDGTRITAEDVIASIKRLLIKKTSTHFPLWEYVDGCDKLTDLNTNCPGLQAINDKTIEIRLKKSSDSFFLQLASPETGIWAKSDIDPKTLELKPTKFSGPYSVSSFSKEAAHLVRNEYNPISINFKNSPRKIDLITAPLAEAEKMMEAGTIDVLFKSHNPYGEKDWPRFGLDLRASSLSTLIYLQGTDLNGAQLVGQDFIQKLWENNTDKELVAAQKFLPFAGGYSLEPNVFFAQLPKKTVKKIRIATPWTYLSDGFLNHLTDTAKQIGFEIEIIRLDRKTWLNSFDDREAKSKYDFIIAPYAASERYPAVQLRYITGSLRKPPIDLKDAETPDLSEEKLKILRDYQKWLLKGQHAVPLYFARDFFVYKKNIDIGEQPPSDAEIELWRVKSK